MDPPTPGRLEREEDVDAKEAIKNLDRMLTGGEKELDDVEMERILDLK